MSEAGFLQTLHTLGYLGYTLKDGNGNLFRSAERVARELASAPPGGVMAGAICGEAMRKATAAIADELFPEGTRVSYHAPHDLSEKFRGVCTRYTSTSNGEVCRIVTIDGTDDTHDCCVDLLEVIDA